MNEVAATVGDPAMSNGIGDIAQDMTFGVSKMVAMGGTNES